MKLPGRPYGVMVEEAYANAGKGCPFGWLRMVDLTRRGAPRSSPASSRVPENDCEQSQAANGTFSAHNQTTFPDVALLTWYSGGLRAVDVSDPTQPVEAGVFVPQGDEGRRRRARRRGCSSPGRRKPKRTGAMWSYPVVQDGLVYAVDIDLGLYVLRYTGPARRPGRAGRLRRGQLLPVALPRAPTRVLRPARRDRPRRSPRLRVTPRPSATSTPVAPGTARRVWDFVC